MRSLVLLPLLLLNLVALPAFAQTTTPVPACRAGGTVQLWAVTTSTLPVTWRVSAAGDTSVLSVDRTGLVSCKKAGSTIVWATAATRGTTRVVVFPPPDTVVLPPPPPPPPPDTTPKPLPNPAGVVFRSNWSAAAGNSDFAVMEGATAFNPDSGRYVGGKWDQSYCTHRDVLSVVPGSTIGWTATANVLQVSNRGDTRCWKVENTTAIPAGSYYVRFYARVDAANAGPTFHSVALAWQSAPASIWSIESNAADGYDATIRYYSGTPYADYAWKCDNRIALRQWYRFEFFVEALSTTRFRVWPRVYDAAGTLVCQAANYRHLDGGTRTLEQYNNSSGGVPYTSLRRLALGYEGTGGNNGVGSRWYYAAVEVRTDTWPGPVR